METVYVMGPYSGPSGQLRHNLYQHERAVHYLLLNGYAPVSYPLQNDCLSGQHGYETFLRASTAIMRKCDWCFRLPAWKTSPGAVREWEVASKFGPPPLEAMEEGFAKLDSR